MAVIVNNVDELKNVVLQKQIESVKKLENKFYDILELKYKEFVDKFYSEYDVDNGGEPRVYPRSHQLRNALPVKIEAKQIGNTISFGIDLSDTSRLEHSHWQVGILKGVRYGDKGEAFAQAIIEDALLHGGHGFYEYTNTAPQKELYKWAEKNIGIFVKLIKDELKKNNMFIVK